MRAFLAILCGFVFTLAVFGSGLAVATWFLAVEPVQPTNASLDVSDVWAREPRTVNSAAQDFQRLPARSDPKAAQQAKPARAALQAAPTAPQPAQTATGSAAQPPQAETAATAPLDTATAATAPLDATDTGSIEPAPRDGQLPPERAELVAAHVEWCARRYRSYQPEDNSYRPYSGGRRPCISPYLMAAAAVEGQAVIESDAAPPAPDAFAADAAIGEIPDDEGDAGFVPDFGYAAPDDEGAEFEVTSDHVAYCFSRYRSYSPEDNTYQPYGGGPRRQCE